MVAVVVRDENVINFFDFFERRRGRYQARDKRRLAENRVEQNIHAVQANQKRSVTERSHSPPQETDTNSLSPCLAK